MNFYNWSTTLYDFASTCEGLRKLTLEMRKGKDLKKYRVEPTRSFKVGGK